MDINSYILWLLLLLVCGLCAYWHSKENRQLAQAWKEVLDSKTAQNLTRFAWSRSIQLFSVLICLVLLVVMYNWQLGQSRLDIQSLNTQIENEKILLAKTVEQEKLPPRVVELVKPTENSMADLYNAEDSNIGSSVAIDALKKRYEEILVTYFFLKKCDMAQALDYHVITSALSHEMASINAPGRLQNDILTAARGSYKEMYAQTRCDGSGMMDLQSQYSNYITTLTKNYTN